MTVGLRLACLLGLVALVTSDVYMHNPRGSNNRLNERSANRNNANRLFDSQNNNRGGYNAGDQETGAFNSEDEIYYMKYFQSGPEAETQLTIEWTNQHGCGGNEDTDTHKLNCNLVIQYMVQDYEDFGSTQTPPTDSEEIATKMRNGANTGTQNHQRPPNGETYAAYVNRRNNNVQADRGLHESHSYYDDCTRRDRNEGLFTADQNLRGDSAKFTRQNPNGNRRGYECPEERDYYPYWHPTPWRDIAVLSDNVSLCESFYQKESFNVAPKQICKERYPTGEVKGHSDFNNQADCEADNADPDVERIWFTEYAYIDIDTPTNQGACDARNNTDGYRRVWAAPSFGEPFSCLVLPNAPDCMQGGWSRDNHLGNGRDGVTLNYTWTLPYFPSGRSKIAILRLRYNISTDDYQPWVTDASFNQQLGAGILSPVEQNPNVDISSTTNKPLRLAINTAQFGRTFQDRTHVMELRPRSALGNADAEACTIHNLNVRGKRGNIVQTYPAVEYDFVPNRLTIKQDECIHFQWTGSNTHNNGAPGGDGQTGDAGEGTGGTDRTNIVEIPDANSSYPIPVGQSLGMFGAAELLYAPSGVTVQNPASDVAVQAIDKAAYFGSIGYYSCLYRTTCGANSVEEKDQMNQLLNNAPASFEGAVLRYRQRANYHYMCSRNNNFTNRSQKGQLTVK